MASSESARTTSGGLDPRDLVSRLWLTLLWYLKQMVRQFMEFDCPTRAGALT